MVSEPYFSFKPKISSNVIDNLSSSIFASAVSKETSSSAVKEAWNRSADLATIARYSSSVMLTSSPPAVGEAMYEEVSPSEIEMV